MVPFSLGGRQKWRPYKTTPFVGTAFLPSVWSGLLPVMALDD